MRVEKNSYIAVFIKVGFRKSFRETLPGLPGTFRDACVFERVMCFCVFRHKSVTKTRAEMINNRGSPPVDPNWGPPGGGFHVLACVCFRERFREASGIKWNLFPFSGSQANMGAQALGLAAG